MARTRLSLPERRPLGGLLPLHVTYEREGNSAIASPLVLSIDWYEI